MARKAVNLPTYVTTTGQSNAAVSLSLAATFTTVSTNLQYQDSCYYQVNITTTNSVGTFYLESSADNVNWVTVGQAGVAAGANDTILCEFDISRTSPWLHLRYVSGAAGTGTCQILIGSKEVGG